MAGVFTLILAAILWLTAFCSYPVISMSTIIYMVIDLKRLFLAVLGCMSSLLVIRIIIIIRCVYSSSSRTLSSILKNTSLKRADSNPESFACNERFCVYKKQRRLGQHRSHEFRDNFIYLNCCLTISVQPTANLVSRSQIAFFRSGYAKLQLTPVHPTANPGATYS